jgi:hypothetical protein
MCDDLTSEISAMTPLEKTTRESFFCDPLYSKFPWAISIIASLLFVIAVFFVVVNRNSVDKDTILLVKFIISAWTLIPPIWFFLEYYSIGKNYKESTDKTKTSLPNIEAFKYSQELAKTIWVAGVAILVVLYTGQLK